MSKLFIVLFLLLFLTNFSLAQSLSLYVFAKKIDGGVLLGVEAPSSEYSFDWNVLAGTIFNKTTNSNTIKIPVNSGIKNISGKIVAKNGQITLEKNFYFVLPEPRVSIVEFDKNLNLILPINYKNNTSNYFFAMPFNFFVKTPTLNYKWIYGGQNVGGSSLLNLNSTTNNI